MLNFLNKKKIVPVVFLSGIIGNIGGLRKGITISSVEGLLEKAFKIKNSASIAIIINSPGGSPVQSSLIYKRIKKLARAKKSKVIFFVEDVAASGGYYIACAGNEIYANSSSIVGSIGVISASFGFQDAIKKIGVERRIYTAGKNKSTLDPFKEEKEEDTQWILF